MVFVEALPMRGQTNRNILVPKLQRRLRNQMTDAEQRLWQNLKGQQLAGFKFRRQHPIMISSSTSSASISC